MSYSSDHAGSSLLDTGHGHALGGAAKLRDGAEAVQTLALGSSHWLLLRLLVLRLRREVVLVNDDGGW